MDLVLNSDLKQMSNKSSWKVLISVPPLRLSSQKVKLIVFLGTPTENPKSNHQGNTISKKLVIPFPPFRKLILKKYLKLHIFLEIRQK